MRPHDNQKNSTPHKKLCSITLFKGSRSCKTASLRDQSIESQGKGNPGAVVEAVRSLFVAGLLGPEVFRSS